MKKLFIFFIALSFLAPSTFAATMLSDNFNKMTQDKLWSLVPVTITSTTSSDIQAKYGIRISLDPSAYVLWQESTLSLTGTAVDSGKIKATIKPEYSKNYKFLSFPVQKDFEVGDSFKIQGLTVKTYDNGFDKKYLGLDLNGDFQTDVSDTNKYELSVTSNSDHIAPYPVTDITYKVNADKTILFNWTTAPDYDYQSTLITRVGIKDGIEYPVQVYDYFTPTFTDADPDLALFPSVTYTFLARDEKGNSSTPVKINVDLAASDPVNPNDPTPVSPTESPDNNSNTPQEIGKLNSLLNYYKLRYDIKCMPSGIPVPENNYECLWARIDLIYSQKITGKILVNDLKLSDRDLYLMDLRRKWPEMRYNDSCVQAEIPANNCVSLKDALDRLSYFLDQD